MIKKLLLGMTLLLFSIQFVIAQEVFFEESNKKENVKSQFYFHKKVPIKGIYFYPNGKIQYIWIKKNNRLGIDDSLFIYYKYGLDSTVTEISLNCEVANDLTIVLFPEYENYFGNFTKTKTDAYQEQKAFGKVKVLSKQRKFALSEVSDVEVELELLLTELTRTYFVDDDYTEIPENKAADKIIVTNRINESTTQKAYFEKIYRNKDLIQSKEVTINRSAKGRTEIHTMITGRSQFYAASGDYPRNGLESNKERITKKYDEKVRLITVELLKIGPSKVHAQREITHRYVEPYVEIIDSYSVNKKGKKRLFQSVEIQNTYF